MIPHAGLHAIATGEASLEEAQATLEALRGDGRRGLANRIYRSLLDWTWGAMYSRRLDPELQEWMDLIRSVEADLDADQEPDAKLVGVLGDLLEKSVLFAEINSDEALIRFAHLGEILSYIRRLNGHANRRDIAAATKKIGNSRLSQLLSTLVKTGKLDREQRGKEAVFHLTSAGTELADRLLEQRRRNAAEIRVSPPFGFEAAKESLHLSFPVSVQQGATAARLPKNENPEPGSENFGPSGQAPGLTQANVQPSRSALERSKMHLDQLVTP